MSPGHADMIDAALMFLLPPKTDAVILGTVGGFSMCAGWDNEFVHVPSSRCEAFRCNGEQFYLRKGKEMSVANRPSFVQLCQELSAYTDKHRDIDGHSYGPIYEDLLSAYRDKPITLIEIGIQCGGSLEVWSRYFSHPDVRIIGIDIAPHKRPELANDPRVQIITGNAMNIRLTDTLPRADIIIDDGSHYLLEQVLAFRSLWPTLNSGGFYCIEDPMTEREVIALEQMMPFETHRLRKGGRPDDVLMIARKREKPV